METRSPSQGNTWTLLARIISLICLPVVWPPLILSLIFPGNALYKIQAWTWLYLLPLLLSFLYFKQKKVKEIWTVPRKDRIIPFLINIVCILVFTCILWLFQPQYYSLLAFTFLLAFNLLSLYITLYWKISLHMIGICGVLGGALGLSGDLSPSPNFYLGLSLLILATAWARYYLRSHDLWQLLAGASLGTGLGFLLVYSLFP